MAAAGGSDNSAGLAKVAAGMLAGFELDLPFVLFYELARNHAEYRLIACHGLVPGTAAGPLALAGDTTTIGPVGTPAVSWAIIENPTGFMSVMNLKRLNDIGHAEIWDNLVVTCGVDRDQATVSLFGLMTSSNDWTFAELSRMPNSLLSRAVPS